MTKTAATPRRPSRSSYLGLELFSAPGTVLVGYVLSLLMFCFIWYTVTFEVLVVQKYKKYGKAAKSCKMQGLRTLVATVQAQRHDGIFRRRFPRPKKNSESKIFYYLCKDKNQRIIDMATRKNYRAIIHMYQSCISVLMKFKLSKNSLRT